MKSRWLRRCAEWLPVAVAALFAASCTREEPPQKPSSRAAEVAPETARPIAADATALGRETPRKAMLSVYFHARYDGDEWVPETYRPLPLETAAGILADDTGRFAESRRRRAIARLYNAPRTELRRRALEALHAPLEQLDTRLSALEEQHEEPEPGSFEFLEWTINELDRLLGPSIPGCERTFPKTASLFDSASSTTTATGWLAAKRTVAELSKVLDPQNWSTCASQHFVDTRVAKKVGADYPVDANYDAEQAPPPSPPPPGSSWSAVLFEHFAVDLGVSDVASFRVLLDIDSKPSTALGVPASYQMTYRLRKPIHSKMGLVQQVGAGIAADQGCAKATEGAVSSSLCVTDTQCTDPSMTCVEAKKVFQLRGWGGSALDFWANFMTSLAFSVWADEAYEMVCCEP